MFTTILYISFGLLLGIFIPHSQRLFNALFSSNMGVVMEELTVMTLPSMITLYVVMVIIGILAYLWDKRKEKKQKAKDEEREKVRMKLFREMLDDVIDKRLGAVKGDKEHE